MPITTLSLRGLKLSVSLGWSAEERLQKQNVMLDIMVRFQEPPKACETDQLNDTSCYAELISILKQYIAEKKFKLIEHLSKDLYDTVKSLLPTTSLVTLRITKQPSIPDLSQGVAFCYGDENITW